MSIFLDPNEWMVLVLALSWTIVHFVWQGLAIGGLVWMTLQLMRRSSANARYLVSSAALALSMAAFFTTLLIMVGRGVGGYTAGSAGPMVIPEVGSLEWLLPYLSACWLLGLCAMLTRLALQWRSAQRLAHGNVSAVDDRWQATFSALCAEMGLRRAARLLQSTVAEAPMVIGWLAPIVLVPVSALTSLTEEQLRTILSHEIAHIRRHDYLLNCLQKIVESILFFHPVVWWISNQMRIERENCCDDAAVQTAGGNALIYARALSQLESLRATPQQLALAANGGSLMNRITRIIGLDTQAHHSTRSGWVVASALTAGLLFSTVGLSYAYGAVTHPHDDDKTKQGVTQKAKVEAYIQEAVAKLKAQVAADQITAEDANLELRAMKKVLAAKIQALEEGKVKQTIEAKVIAQLTAINKLKAATKAGEISEKEAQARIQDLHLELAGRLEAAASQSLPVDRHVQVQAHLDQAMAELHTMVQSGEISQDEAHEKIKYIHEKIAESMVEKGAVVQPGSRLPSDRSMERDFHETIPYLSDLPILGEALFQAERDYESAEAHAHLQQLHLELQEAAAAGEISHEHAALKMDQVKQQFDEQLHQKHRIEQVHQHLQQLGAELHEAVNAGAITIDAAKAQMEMARLKVAQQLPADRSILQRVDERQTAHQHLQQVGAELKALVKTGEMSADEADAKMDFFKQQVDSSLGYSERPADFSADRREQLHAHLEEVAAKLKAAVKEGHISADEARARMNDLKKEAGLQLHEVKADAHARQLDQHAVALAEARAHLQAVTAKLKAMVEAGDLPAKVVQDHLERLHEELSAGDR